LIVDLNDSPGSPGRKTSLVLLFPKEGASRVSHVSTGLGRYREIAPPARLRKAVECFWHREPGAVEANGPVLPDGCIDVIWRGNGEPVIAGPATRAMAVDPSEGSEFVGVRFRPGGAPSVLGIGAREVLDQHVSLRSIWSQKRASSWLDLMMRPTLTEKLESISELIAERLVDGDTQDAIVHGVVLWVARHPRASIDEIAQHCGISERHLLRRFEQAVGYGPKTLQRILRLQRLLWLARGTESASPDLARLAIVAGYADQPHMTRETHALTGATPRQLLFGSRLTSAVSDLFKTTTGHDATLSLPG
jgi:AraC-like DNA-binding protein